MFSLKFGCLLFIFAIILQTITNTKCEYQQNLQQGFTTRCDEICSESSILELQKDLKPDCQRGCQYFNIQFLISASDKTKVNELQLTKEKCKMSCLEAYVQTSKKDACNIGCQKMMELQEKAPYINGWLVYMGASDRNMVLLQPDFEIPSDDDWVLLDSVLRPNDYDKVFDQYKLTETRIQTMPIYPVRSHFTINYCIPTWMWMVPIILILGFIWMHYGNYLNGIFIQEELLDEDLLAKEKKVDENDFNVATDTYFYPSPAVPPPKYNEVVEAMLLTSDDEDFVKNIPLPHKDAGSN